MKYFQTLPSVINVDQNNNFYILKNIIARSALLPELSRNPMLFYQYTIQDSDTPENIAYKYYGDQYRYWIILLGNDTFDPQFDWPLTSQQFEQYIIQKYKEEAANYYDISVETITNSQIFAYVNGTVHHYEQWITSTDNSSQTTSRKILVVDLTTYNLISETTNTYTLPNNSTVKKEVKKRIVSIYEYEFELNEEKRNINIIQDKYVSDMENALKTSMS